MIAFTDWVEGPAGLDAAEAERTLRFMKSPSSSTTRFAILESDEAACSAVSEEMAALQALAYAGKIIQGRLIVRRPA